MTIDDLIASIFTTKTEGNREFILSRDNLGGWFAAIGNKSQSVCIGEAISYTTEEAEFYAKGATAQQALENLLRKITDTAPEKK